jgi:hypothetical protein
VGNNQHQYYVGPAPGQYAGSRCAFISNSASSWTSANQAAYRHIYRNVSFPANSEDIELSFFYKLSAWIPPTTASRFIYAKQAIRQLRADIQAALSLG